jgi:Predicted lipase
MVWAADAYKNILPFGGDSCHLVISDTNTDVQCYIVREDDTLYVIFRGSNSPRDWVTNLQFGKKVVPYGNYDSKIRVHNGFVTSYKDSGIRDRLHSLISDDITKIKITGHSYGAALSTLCAVDLQYNFPCLDIQVIVFGSPRVGNSAFKKSYNQRIIKSIRVENGNDIVTKIPFAFMGFRHVGSRFHVGKHRIFGRLSLNAHYQYAYYQSLLKRLL